MNIVKIGEFGRRVKNVRKKSGKMKGVKNSIFRANIVKIGEFGCRAKNVRKTFGKMTGVRRCI